MERDAFNINRELNRAFQQINQKKYGSIKLMALQKGQVFKFSGSRSNKLYEMISVSMKYPYSCIYVALETGEVYTSTEGFKRVTI